MSIQSPRYPDQAPTAPAARRFGHRGASRPGYTALALFLVAFAAFESVKYGVPAFAVLLLFLVVPDLSMIGRHPTELQKGQFSAAVTKRYNLAHNFWIPVALMALSFVPWPELWLPTGLEVFLAGLGWAAHIAIDRALGFGRRGPDGWMVARRHV